MSTTCVSSPGREVPPALPRRARELRGDPVSDEHLPGAAALLAFLSSSASLGLRCRVIACHRRVAAWRLKGG